MFVSPAFTEHHALATSQPGSVAPGDQGGLSSLSNNELLIFIRVAWTAGIPANTALLSRRVFSKRMALLSCSLTFSSFLPELSLETPSQFCSWQLWPFLACVSNSSSLYRCPAPEPRPHFHFLAAAPPSQYPFLSYSAARLADRRTELRAQAALPLHPEFGVLVASLGLF